MSEHSKTDRQRKRMFDNRKKARRCLDKLAEIIQDTYDSTDNAAAEFALMFNDPIMAHKVQQIILPVVSVGASYNPLKLGKYAPLSVSNEKIDLKYQNVWVHLSKLGTWDRTVAKFPPATIRSAVRQILEREPSDSLDLSVEFEHLREYDTIESFIEWLETEKKIRRDFNKWAYNSELQRLETEAEYFNMVIISKYEHDRLLRLERSLKTESKVTIPRVVSA
jgi:hypothetical protein